MLALLVLALVLVGRNISRLIELFEPHTEHSVLPADSRFYLPECEHGELQHHHYLSLCYDDSLHDTRWVAYELYYNWLVEPALQHGAELRKELSTYARWSREDPGFKAGVWRELEELTYDWVREDKHLYITEGPVYSSSGEPEAFFKVFLDLQEPEVKGIGYVVPNEKTSVPMDSFALSIHEVELLTGINFFHELMLDSLAHTIKHDSEPVRWKTNEQRYQKRVKVWNQ
jgi:DNA/RNA endonuclease G (NUC1)